MYDPDLYEAEERGFSDPRLDAWTAFRNGEIADHATEDCCVCGQEIPEEDDVIEQFDTNGTLEGRICEDCANEPEE